jgi:hypothetical protein
VRGHQLCQLRNLRDLRQNGTHRCAHALCVFEACEYLLSLVYHPCARMLPSVVAVMRFLSPSRMSFRWKYLPPSSKGAYFFSHISSRHFYIILKILQAAVASTVEIVILDKGIIQPIFAWFLPSHVDMTYQETQLSPGDVLRTPLTCHQVNGKDVRKTFITFTQKFGL